MVTPKPVRFWSKFSKKQGGTVNVDLKVGERIDDLQCRGLKIIQNEDGFCFGVDAVLLANFAEVKRGQRVADLGTGTGIPLHNSKFDFDEDVLCTGVDIYMKLLKEARL
jgi:tRNA1(Val) A37 N6-methylase TrmN6